MYTKNVVVINFIMIGKIVLLVISYLLMVIGFSYLWLYLNLFSFGYSLGEYICYVLTRYECYLFVIGFILFNIFLFRKGKNK